MGFAFSICDPGNDSRTRLESRRTECDTHVGDVVTEVVLRAEYLALAVAREDWGKAASKAKHYPRPIEN